MDFSRTLAGGGDLARVSQTYCIVVWSTSVLLAVQVANTNSVSDLVASREASSSVSIKARNGTYAFDDRPLKVKS